MNEFEWGLVGLAALAAGALNALAGGGTLISFPVLMAVGVPAVIANITNAVSLCPGYLAAVMAQSGDLHGQTRRLRWYLPAGVLGGILGGFLLLQTGEKIFRALVPFLILFASLLLVVQEPLRRRLLRRSGHSDAARLLERTGVVPAFLASIYGGYFGAGVSVVILAVLGVMLEDTLTRVNALKQGIALAINLAAALFFVFSGMVDWPVAGVMAAGALAGGFLGGKCAGRVHPEVLRWTAALVGFGVAGVYFIR